MRAQETTPTTQPPAPIVRARPRPQASTVPATAPPEAAPLVVHPPRPKPSAAQLDGALPHPSASTTAPKSARTQTPTASATASSATPTQAQNQSQTKAPSASTLNRSVVVLDPAHGGADSGSRIGDALMEKDVTLALAFRLRSLLAARGFTVVLTRDSDAALSAGAQAAPLTLDDRAGTANHAHAAACLLIHATGRGTGVHLYGSDLEPTLDEAAPLPWLTAQSAWIPASLQLERGFGAALSRSHIPLVSSTASVRPVDSLTCPALVVELAPETEDVRSVNDAGYQERVATALAGALVVWENQVQAPLHLTTPTSPAHTAHHHAAPSVPADTPGVQP